MRKIIRKGVSNGKLYRVVEETIYYDVINENHIVETYGYIHFLVQVKKFFKWKTLNEFGSQGDSLKTSAGKRLRAIVTFNTLIHG